jgi:MerR family transcriptional regulator/heat shock protein HspR
MLREVVRLSSLGIGLEGVRQVLQLEDQVSALQFRVRELQAELDALRAERAERSRTALVVWRGERDSWRSPWMPTS